MNIFLQSYRPCGLPNGCLPEAYFFYDALRRTIPGAKAEVLLLELPDGVDALYGHAVVLIHRPTGTMLWDHEAGPVAMETPQRIDKETLRAAAARSYLAAIARLKAPTRIRQSPQLFAHAVVNEQAACLIAARLLSGRQPMLIVYRTPSHGSKCALSFMGGGMVWVYLPEIGAAFVPIRAGQTPDQLSQLALRSSVAGSEIIRISPFTPQGPLMANLRSQSLDRP